MPIPIVEITAGARLHFGMLAFGLPGTRQFGGVGAMIDQPALRLRFSPAERLEVVGPLAERVGDFARRFLDATAARAPAATIEILAAPREHAGLGSGTQLALAVAAGLNALAGGPTLAATELARRVGRGQRSAIGTHGFEQGGLLVEAGKTDAAQVSPLVARVALPEAWRFVVASLTRAEGLSGEPERQAFVALPPVPRETTAELCAEALLELLPAAREADFERFSQSLFRYGRRAGMCFASQQQGKFATPAALPLIERWRRLGVEGVGQSSWGPTVFALLPNVAQADDAARQLQASWPEALEIHVAAASNRGAVIAGPSPR